MALQAQLNTLILPMNLLPRELPGNEILYYCHALPESESLEDIQATIAKYEAENAETIAAFNDFAKSKGKQPRWMLGLWSNVYCNWYRNEGDEDE